MHLFCSQAFRQIDGKGNGIVTKRELRDLLYKFIMPMSDAEFKRLWARSECCLISRVLMDCCSHENISKVIVGICVNLMSFLCSSTIFFSLGGGGG